jgi:hypothetical protein
LSCGAASAAFDPSQNVTVDPSTYATEIVSAIDISMAPNVFDYPDQFGNPYPNGSFDTSGYVNEFMGIEVDRTELVSRVYRVHTMTNVGALTLNPGDNVYTYTITLVDFSTNTVNGLGEFQVGAVDFGLTGPVMDSTLVLGRGYVGPTGGANAPSIELASDLSAIGPFGASLDWEWADTGGDDYLQNSATITLTMYTSSSMPIVGTAVFASSPGIPSNVDPNSTGAHVWVPAIPTPGPLVITGAGVLFASARRRRS